MINEKPIQLNLNQIPYSMRVGLASTITPPDQPVDTAAPPQPENTAAIAEFKKIKTELREKSLNGIQIEAMTHDGPSQMAVSEKEVVIRVKSDDGQHQYGCELNTGACTHDKKPATEAQIKAFQQLAKEIHEKTKSGHCRVSVTRSS
ncbi:hypothetical protein EBR96_01275 [bacterium]|nr:hypothetical protein [bacterium]